MEGPIIHFHDGRKGRRSVFDGIDCLLAGESRRFETVHRLSTGAGALSSVTTLRLLLTSREGLGGSNGTIRMWTIP